MNQTNELKDVVCVDVELKPVHYVLNDGEIIEERRGFIVEFLVDKYEVAG